MDIDVINHIAHKLRTPLTIIKEASSMLLEGTFTHTPEKQHDLYLITAEECERLIGAVNKILDFLRTDSGITNYSFKKTSINYAVNSAISKSAPFAQKKNIKIKIDIPDNLLPVNMDEEKMSRALEMLLYNAIKFNPNGGNITIAVSQDIENSLIKISCKDTGSGIPEDQLKRIINKLKENKNKLTINSGLGIGLCITKYIINSHGGQIWAESKINKGSTFYFTLPLCV